MYLLKIGFSGITPANLNGSGYFTGVCRPNSNLMCSNFSRPGPKERKMSVKTGSFCNRYNELSFLCNGSDGHGGHAKTSIAILCWTLIEEFWKFAFKGWFCTKPPFLGCFDGSPCHRSIQIRGYVFRLIEAFLLLEEGSTVCLCVAYHFGCRRPLKLPKFR